MTNTVNKYSTTFLYSSSNDLYSHLVRFVLAEKNVSADIIEIEPNDLNQELLDINPYNTVPTLVDRELVLYNSKVIVEYLEERFPHPPLMPIYPVKRAQYRLMMERIQTEWYQLANDILQNKNVTENRRELNESILAIASIFKETDFFMSEEFSLLDCFLAPLFWRLPLLGIELTGNNGLIIKDYMTKIFEKESFILSLTSEERKFKVGIYDKLSF